MFKKTLLLSCILAATGAQSAMAYEAGDMVLRFGAAHVSPDDAGEPDGVFARSNSQAAINFSYFFTNDVAIEVLASTPFEHDVILDGVGNVGTTKHLPPTVSVQYYFNNESVVTPYLGLGLNYTIFFDEDLKEAQELGAIPDDNLELDNSFGVAYQFGFDVALDANWGINVDIRKIDIATEIANNNPLKGTEVDIDPTVYSLTAVYKF